MEAGDVLSIKGFIDRELSRDRVDDEDAGGRLVSSRAGHTVSEGPVLVMVRTDLWVQRLVIFSLKCNTRVWMLVVLFRYDFPTILSSLSTNVR